MPKISLKLSSWEGKNKARVRLHKLYKVSELKDDGIEPTCLTFAGSKAKFEKLLNNHGIARPKDILTIQTYEKLSENHYGSEILGKLVRTRKNHLGGMKIWPYNFLSFSKCYRGDKCEYPSKSKTANWSKPPWSSLMNNIVKNPMGKFSVLDIDLCGIFNQKNSDGVVNLFRNKVLDKEGAMFLTHLKGRDVRGGKLYEILLNGIKESDYVEFDQIKKMFDTDPNYYSRYVLIPLYYMSKAYDNGYVLWLDKLIEYRDKNPDTGLAVNMLQYFFGWYSQEESKMDCGELRLDSMCSVIDEEYNYQAWID